MFTLGYLSSPVVSMENQPVHACIHGQLFVLSCRYAVQLAELPESFSKLSKLKTLDVFHNRLTDIPDCLDSLKMLTRLDLGEV